MRGFFNKIATKGYLLISAVDLDLDGSKSIELREREMAVRR
jgi:hypothetical protein